jgi:hypothetical protein
MRVSRRHAKSRKKRGFQIDALERAASSPRHGERQVDWQMSVSSG